MPDSWWEEFNLARSRLDPAQTDALEATLIRIYKRNPTEPYQSALQQVYELLPELTNSARIGSSGSVM